MRSRLLKPSHLSLWLLCLALWALPVSRAHAADADHDGISDSTDLCPVDPEDRDGFQDQDGCPDPDNDGDGILDTLDTCPSEPEDHDGFQDEDGCPEPDNDADGIPDVSDMCPSEPETFDGHADTDGCPDATPRVVIKTHPHPTGPERLYFAPNTYKLTPKHKEILHAVVAVLKDHPDLKVRIEGHTDLCGDDKPVAASELSTRRAQSALAELVAQGISPDRLEAQGFGDTRPLVDISTLKGPDRRRACEMLRRVEFFAVTPP